MNKICVGLDLTVKEGLYNYYSIINSTKDYCEIYKINPAFFYHNKELIFPVIEYLKKNNLKFIYDGKLGDVCHTNEKYANYVYNILEADGVTLNPYLGFESLKPFSKYEDKINFIVCRSTNRGAEFLQDVIYKEVYKSAKENNFGIVVAGNKELYLKEAIQYCPNSPILVPGIGAQGGNILEVKNKNLIYSISRSIIFSENPREEIKKYALWK